MCLIFANTVPFREAFIPFCRFRYYVSILHESPFIQRLAFQRSDSSSTLAVLYLKRSLAFVNEVHFHWVYNSKWTGPSFLF